MLDIKVSVCGTKQEVDEFCDRMGWERKEFNHRSRGWSFTTVYNDEGQQVGSYVARVCELEVEPEDVAAGVRFLAQAVRCNVKSAEQAKT